MTTIRVRVRTTARKLALKVRPGVRVTLPRPTIPGKTPGARIRRVTRVQKDHD
jgi:hypothetical protein